MGEDNEVVDSSGERIRGKKVKYNLSFLFCKNYYLQYVNNSFIYIVLTLYPTPEICFFNQCLIDMYHSSPTKLGYIDKLSSFILYMAYYLSVPLYLLCQCVTC